MSPGRRSSGFTLIEILIVMSIIGVLAGMVLIAMGSIQKGAKDEATKALVERLNLYIADYYRKKAPCLRMDSIRQWRSRARFSRARRLFIIS